MPFPCSARSAVLVLGGGGGRVTGTALCRVLYICQHVLLYCITFCVNWRIIVTHNIKTLFGYSIWCMLHVSLVEIAAL